MCLWSQGMYSGTRVPKYMVAGLNCQGNNSVCQHYPLHTLGLLSLLIDLAASCTACTALQLRLLSNISNLPTCKHINTGRPATHCSHRLIGLPSASTQCSLHCRGRRCSALVLPGLRRVQALAQIRGLCPSIRGWSRIGDGHQLHCCGARRPLAAAARAPAAAGGCGCGAGAAMPTNCAAAACAPATTGGCGCGAGAAVLACSRAAAAAAAAAAAGRRPAAAARALAGRLDARTTSSLVTCSHQSLRDVDWTAQQYLQPRLQRWCPVHPSPAHAGGDPPGIGLH
jgi:hypothetical protein